MMMIYDKCRRIVQEYNHLSTEVTGLIKTLLETFGTPVMRPRDERWPRCSYYFPDLKVANISVEAYWTGEDVPVVIGIIMNGVHLSSSLVDDDVWYDDFLKDKF